MKKLVLTLVTVALLSSCNTATDSDSGSKTTSGQTTEQTAGKTDDGTQTLKTEQGTENDTIPLETNPAGGTATNTISPETNAAEATTEPIKNATPVVTDENFDQFAPPEKGEQIAIIKTSMGDIKLKFFPEDAPKSVENFIGLAKKGYYNNLTFHRVFPQFMIQGGDPTGTGSGGESLWGSIFEDEFSARLHNYKGALAMAHPGLEDANGSQFFIVQAGPVKDEQLTKILDEISAYKQVVYEDTRLNQKVTGTERFTAKAVKNYKEKGGTPWLDSGFNGQQLEKSHTVFGQVFEGIEVVDAIATVAADTEGKPGEPVVITGVEISNY